MNNKLREEVNYITRGIFAYNILVFTILSIMQGFSKEMLMGLIFGSLIAVLNFRQLALSIEKMVTMPTHKAQIYSSSQYVIRMFITGIVLFVAVKASHLNVIGVAIGLLGPKFIILTRKLVIEKVKRKEA